MRRFILPLITLLACGLLLTQCSKVPEIRGKVSSVGYIWAGQDRSKIDYYSVEVRSDGNLYECRFTPASAKRVLGEELAQKMLVPDPDRETNQLILTDEPLQNKIIVATLADLKPTGQNRFVANLVRLNVQD